MAAWDGPGQDDGKQRGGGPIAARTNTGFVEHPRWLHRAGQGSPHAGTHTMSGVSRRTDLLWWFNVPACRTERLCQICQPHNRCCCRMPVGLQGPIWLRWGSGYGTAWPTPAAAWCSAPPCPGLAHRTVWRGLQHLPPVHGDGGNPLRLSVTAARGAAVVDPARGSVAPIAAWPRHGAAAA